MAIVAFRTVHIRLEYDLINLADFFLIVKFVKFTQKTVVLFNGCKQSPHGSRLGPLTPPPIHTRKPVFANLWIGAYLYMRTGLTNCSVPGDDY